MKLLKLLLQFSPVHFIEAYYCMFFNYFLVIFLSQLRLFQKVRLLFNCFIILFCSLFCPLHIVFIERTIQDILHCEYYKLRPCIICRSLTRVHILYRKIKTTMAHRFFFRCISEILYANTVF